MVAPNNRMEVRVNRYRVIDPDGKQPIAVVEIVGPPNEDLAKGIAARAILECSSIPSDSPALLEVTNRLVVKPVDDQHLRWVVRELHTCFEMFDGWAYGGDEIRINEYSPDGVILAFHQISRNTGCAFHLARQYILVTARSLHSTSLSTLD